MGGTDSLQAVPNEQKSCVTAAVAAAAVVTATTQAWQTPSSWSKMGTFTIIYPVYFPSNLLFYILNSLIPKNMNDDYEYPVIHLGLIDHTRPFCVWLWCRVDQWDDGDEPDQWDCRWGQPIRLLMRQTNQIADDANQSDWQDKLKYSAVKEADQSAEDQPIISQECLMYVSWCWCDAQEDALWKAARRTSSWKHTSSRLEQTNNNPSSIHRLKPLT